MAQVWPFMGVAPVPARVSSYESPLAVVVIAMAGGFAEPERGVNRATAAVPELVERAFHRSSRRTGMETIIGILFPVTFIAALILERVFPARPLPRVKGWLLKGIAFFVMSAVLGGVV